MIHLNTIQRYRDYRSDIQDLLSSTINSLAEEWRLDADSATRHESLKEVCQHFPFIGAVYALNEQGRQQGETFISPSSRGDSTRGDGADRSHRPK